MYNVKRLDKLFDDPNAIDTGSFTESVFKPILLECFATRSNCNSGSSTENLGSKVLRKPSLDKTTRLESYLEVVFHKTSITSVLL
ncbi:hypothetical protein WICMUC_002608 [Wickerhamomyces mucosus]|uniref:Uncharacterized protein n=1 Tax=Wickerhamomyces mucosus TaxID=1378264 RepID=A0A9P8PQ65_9ASCO|nr:hypothetical protein WICMUC_002608 [Wickerhamomyces mucosus]